MRVLAIDDELLPRRMLVGAIREACPDAEIFDFSKASELLSFAETTPCEIAFCDIRLRDMTGIELAKRLKNLQPKINIVFVTGYEDYAVEAIFMRASGYVMKPVTKEKILEELKELRYPIQLDKKDSLLRVKCFGDFDVFTSAGVPVKFTRAKSKEMLAYLVHIRGARCTMRELASVLFEECLDVEKQLSYIRTLIVHLNNSLREVKAEKVIIKEHNTLAIVPSLIDCDAYRFEDGDVNAINSYLGEYMHQYSWAEFASEYYDKKCR